MTSIADLEAKIAEADYFLDRMIGKPNRPEITYNFHAFANALYSAKEYAKELAIADPLFKQKLNTLAGPHFDKGASPEGPAFNLINEERRNDVHRLPAPVRKQFKAIFTSGPVIDQFEERYFLGNDAGNELYATCKLALNLVRKLI